MKKKMKFDETDRRRVIAELEREREITLKRVGKRRKHLKDENGREYWVLGGVEDWHGIPSDMMESGLSDPTNVDLVIARRLNTKIEIYAGPAELLITAREYLIHTQKGDFQFNVQSHGDYLSINENFRVRLKKFCEVNYSDDEKETDVERHQVTSELNRIWENLSPVEKEDFMKINSLQKAFEDDESE